MRSRLNREQFYDRVQSLDPEQLRKVMWTLYWRGTTAVRERVETELDAVQHGIKPQTRRVDPVLPELVRAEVDQFVELARSGAYFAGSRLVSPKERTRWRGTFKALVRDVQAALADSEPDDGIAAAERLLGLVGPMRDTYLFRSEDPIEAAQFVVSDMVELLWTTMLARFGFADFAKRAAPQLIRWESRYGWTRRGEGRVPAKEVTLATVLSRLLTIPDAWVGFADAYLDALDTLVPVRTGASRRGSNSRGRREDRTDELSEWHALLVEHLADSEAEARLDRLVQHPALAGPELAFLRAQVHRSRGDLDGARREIRAGLDSLPGRRDFLRFAEEVGAPTPARHR